MRTLSSKKADAGGHSADVFACAIFRALFILHFRRRRERQLEAVTKVLTEMFKLVGSQALNNCIVTADRGYGKETIMNLMTLFGLFFYIHNAKSCSEVPFFVAASFLNPHRDKEEPSGGKSSGEVDVVASNDDTEELMGEMGVASLGRYCHVLRIVDKGL